MGGCRIEVFGSLVDIKTIISRELHYKLTLNGFTRCTYTKPN